MLTPLFSEIALSTNQSETTVKDLPTPVIAQIFSFTGDRNHKLACKNFHTHCCYSDYQKALTLCAMNGSTRLLSTFGINCPQIVTIEESKAFLRNTCLLIQQIIDRMPEEIRPRMAAKDFAFNPDEIELFLKKVYDYSLKQALGALAGVSPETSLEESVKAIKKWLKETDLQAITELDLSGTNLFCIPNEIFQFSHLAYLNLRNNQLNTVPSELGNLKKLEDLDLGYNKLTTLPTEFENLKELEELDLSNNQITNIPKELGNLRCLGALVLCKNRLTDLPAELGNLKELEDLDLSQNELTTLPAELGDLKKLEDLDISHNKLSTLPAELKNLTNLELFILENNPITSLPEELLALEIFQKEFQELCLEHARQGV